ncbi:hypothetical protein BDV24DRAFT_157353 [Aspergillus arachidicola]|uniref:Zn(2)-C6 fungal-type domain-containing protein n=1 Tax=Aspergillus arachidicola TaxID=656916 RepID=A0A5N6YSJ7_9EURO|nr:hypothetical protein BDV24DRAFT_157353 [Aspergillus arachidicola]
MDMSRAVLPACEQCRERRQKCDRGRPQCSYCSQRNRQCTYQAPASDAQPSPLLQELISIREQLDSISTIVDKTRPARPLVTDPYISTNQQSRNVAYIGLKSPLLMQMVGLSPDLSAQLYRLEKRYEASPNVDGTHISLTIAENTLTLLLRSFYHGVHLWYPILSNTFTREFFEAIACRFPPSTHSCLSLLVAAIGTLLLDQAPHSSSEYLKAAFSMLPLVLQENSVTSVQCLVLFSIYFACLAIPRKMYGYIRLASLRIGAIRAQTPGEKGENGTLTAQLYWVIFLIQSEIRVHFDLAPAKRWPNQPIPLPSSGENCIWTFPGGATLRPDPHPSSTEICFYFRKEVELQALIEHGANATSASNPLRFPPADEKNDLHYWCNSWPNALPFNTLIDPSGMTSLSERVTYIMAKYHSYEVSFYLPAISRIITTGQADVESLPYGPLFFDSMAKFLAAAVACVRPFSPKSWPLCGSIFTASLVALKAMEIPCLRALVHSTVFDTLTEALNRLQQFGKLSPSVLGMWRILNERLQQANATA